MRPTIAFLSLLTLLPAVARAQEPPPAPPTQVPAPIPPEACCAEPPPPSWSTYAPTPATEVPSPADRLIHLKSGRWLRLREAQSAARAGLGVGTSFIILGSLIQGAGIALAATAGPAMLLSCAEGSCGELGATVAISATGTAMLAVGIASLVSGAKLKQELKRYQPSLSLAPTSGGGTVAASIRF